MEESLEFCQIQPRMGADNRGCQEEAGGDLPLGLDTFLPGDEEEANACPVPFKLKGRDFIFDSLQIKILILKGKNVNRTQKSCPLLSHIC